MFFNVLKYKKFCYICLFIVFSNIVVLSQSKSNQYSIESHSAEISQIKPFIMILFPSSIKTNYIVDVLDNQINNPISIYVGNKEILLNEGIMTPFTKINTETQPDGSISFNFKPSWCKSYTFKYFLKSSNLILL